MRLWKVKAYKQKIKALLTKIKRRLKSKLKNKIKLLNSKNQLQIFLKIPLIQIKIFQIIFLQIKIWPITLHFLTLNHLSINRIIKMIRSLSFSKTNTSAVKGNQYKIIISLQVLERMKTIFIKVHLIYD